MKFNLKNLLKAIGVGLIGYAFIWFIVWLIYLFPIVIFFLFAILFILAAYTIFEILE